MKSFKSGNRDSLYLQILQINNVTFLVSGKWLWISW